MSAAASRLRRSRGTANGRGAARRADDIDAPSPGVTLRPCGAPAPHGPSHGGRVRGEDGQASTRNTTRRRGRPPVRAHARRARRNGAPHACAAFGRLDRPGRGAPGAVAREATLGSEHRPPPSEQVRRPRRRGAAMAGDLVFPGGVRGNARRMCGLAARDRMVAPVRGRKRHRDPPRRVARRTPLRRTSAADASGARAASGCSAAGVEIPTHPVHPRHRSETPSDHGRAARRTVGYAALLDRARPEVRLTQSPPLGVRSRRGGRATPPAPPSTSNTNDSPSPSVPRNRHPQNPRPPGVFTSASRPGTSTLGVSSRKAP